MARWSFKVNGSSSASQVINLGNTYDVTKLVNGKIAPGTSGSFKISIDATGSDVGIEYAIDLQPVTDEPINLQFSTGVDWVDSMDDIEPNLRGVINANDPDKIRNLTVIWQWPYDANCDEQDTNIGKTLSEYKINAVVTGTQVNPNNV